MRTTIAISLMLLLGGAAAAWWLVEGRPIPAQFSALLRSQPERTCAAHGLPAEECPFCKPELIEKLGECGGHQVPEALCWLCHPELVAAFKQQKDWCAEHDRPESLCAICNPAGALRAATPASPATATGAEDFGTPRSQRPPAPECTNGKQLVTLASEDMARRAGLQLVDVQRTPLGETLRCTAETRYNENAYARVSPRVEGVLHELHADLGQLVADGAHLATIDSPGLAIAKSEYLQSLSEMSLAERTFERERGLLDRGVSSEREAFEAETRLAESRITTQRLSQRLLALGLAEAEIASLAQRADTSALLRLTAPSGGIIVERTKVLGESVDPSSPLFSVADTATLWVMLDLTERQADRASPGMPVRFVPAALPDRAYQGTLSWISAQLDPRTRTIKARAIIDNPGGTLRANVFGQAEIAVEAPKDRLTVPKEAVQWDGCCNIVFVAISPTVFRPQKVLLGLETGELFEVREGLQAADRVVTQGSFLLKTEILKGEIGAGCCPAD